MEAGDQDSTGAGVAVPFEQAVSRTLELPLPRPRPRQPPLQQLTARSVQRARQLLSSLQRPPQLPLWLETEKSQEVKFSRKMHFHNFECDNLLFATEYKLRKSYSFLTNFPNVILLFRRILRGFISNKPNTLWVFFIRNWILSQAQFLK